MKRINVLLSALVLGVGMISLTGCEESERFVYGSAVSFQCVSSSHSTRAAYSGYVDDVEGVERIDWQSDDKIRIYCAQASKPSSKYSDYVITGITPDGALSEATISNVKADSLCWGATEPHYFYAVYPSPAASGSWVSEIQDKKVTGTVEASQSGNAVFSEGMVLVAKNLVPDPTKFDKDKVFLKFKPLTTAIKFSIANGQTTDLTVTKVELKSANHPLSGKFSYNIGEGKVLDESITDAEKKVEISTSVPLTANKVDTYEFTFFLRPDDNLDDLSIVVTTSGTTYTSKLQTEGGAFTFESGKKYVIKGVVLEKWLTLESIYQKRVEEEIPEQILF